MVRVYATAWHSINLKLQQLQSEYDKAISLGVQPSASWIYEKQRALEFKKQVAEQLLIFSKFAETSTHNQITIAIEQAQKEAALLVQIELGVSEIEFRTVWNKIPTETVLEIVGITNRESPLHSLFMNISAYGAEKAEEVLIQGILMGKNPIEIAPEIREALGVGLSRALRIARTETLRAHRESTLLAYQENADIVKGWIWHSALDDRTCAVCYAMHGTVHQLTERLNDHPNGRCAMIPITKSWDEIFSEIFPGVSGDLKIAETRPEITPGEEVFKRLPEERQMEILGKKLYSFWKGGNVPMRDLVVFDFHHVWGATPRLKSLKELGVSDENQQ